MITTARRGPTRGGTLLAAALIGGLAAVLAIAAGLAGAA
jgi:hypothetical protein